MSHKQFDIRWWDLASHLVLDRQYNAVLQRIDGTTAYLDLGSGLVGQAATAQLVRDDNSVGAAVKCIGETFSVTVKSVQRNNYYIELEVGDYAIAQIIAEGETGTVEFKSTLRVNLKSDDKRFDKRMEDEVLGAIAAFLNTDGGVLYIGVQDDGTALDVVKVDSFSDEDKMSLHLVNLVEKGIDNSVWSDIKVSFEEYRGKRILVVRCRQSIRPIYATGSDGQKRFYVRRGPSSKPLEIDEVTEYITRHFQNNPP